MQTTRAPWISAKNIIALLVVVLVFFALYLSSLTNYLLFHSLAELFGVLVAMSIFVIYWNSRRFLDDGYFILLGIAYFFVGGMDLVHVLAYQGMGVFPGSGSNLPTQLWIAARYLESFSLLIATFCIRRKPRTRFVLIGYLIISSILLGTIFYWQVFPDGYIEGLGLTPFKKISEYVISLILVAAWVRLYQERKLFAPGVYRLLTLSIMTTIGSELAFTLYVSVYGFFNMLGHLLKVASFYFIYRALIDRGLRRPYNLIFADLNRSEEKYRLHFQQASDVVLAIDPEFKVVDVSPSVEKLVGYRPEELIGRPFQDLNILAPDSQESVVSDAMGVLTGEQIVASKYELIAKNGTRRFAEASVTPVVRNGEVVSLAAIVRDITERVQLEEALRIHQEHLETMVEERTAKLARLNQRLQQEILERRQAQEALQRRSRELEFLNRTGQALNSSLNLDQVLNTILEETRDLLAATACSVWLIEPGTDELVCQQAVGLGNDIVRGWRLAPGEGLAGQVARTGESLIVPDTRAEDHHFKGVDQKVGTELRSILVLPLRSKDVIIGVIQVLHAETDRFVKENLTLLELLATSAAISIQNAQLYQDLRGQMHVLQEVQAVLVRNEKMTALGRLAASIAHEINNPLQSMQNSMLLLREELEGNCDPDEIDYCLGVTDDEIDRIAAIVRRMRDFYWTERQGRPPPYPGSAPVEDFYRLTQEELQAVNVRTLLEDVLRLTNKQFQHSDVAVECSWAENLPLPQGNPDYLKQVFLNLTLNAIDAMTDRGGTFMVRTEVDQIQWEDGQLQPAVRIELSDTGEGIPPEIMSRLFEPFLTTKAHGSGFGLFTSYKIIEAHKGQIDVESQVGLGTTFRILLPAESA